MTFQQKSVHWSFNFTTTVKDIISRKTLANLIHTNSVDLPGHWTRDTCVACLGKEKSGAIRWAHQPTDVRGATRSKQPESDRRSAAWEGATSLQTCAGRRGQKNRSRIGGAQRRWGGRALLVGNGVAGLARVWNNYSIPRVEISPDLYIYIYILHGLHRRHRISLI